jgi:hypothetical protein
MLCKECSATLDFDGTCPKCGPSMNGPEMEYHFKCKNCGTDLGGGESDAQGFNSLSVASGSILDDPPTFDEIRLPRIKIECSLEFYDGKTRSEIPLNPVRDNREPEVIESFTVHGNCPLCGTAFVRQVRRKQ